ncbi:MAG TPA: DUF3291 domain-containing protein [Aeromonadales bacterium]|nr:DUF3291 domain-containing protein [Aeromonadales bacterium]
MQHKYHIAQLNIAKAVAEMDTKTMADFVARLDEINQLADDAPGFIWRLQTESGDSTAIRVFDDPLMLVNISVWQNIEALKNFVYKSFHVELIRDREAWFNKMAEAHQVLWWVEAGHIPGINEAKAKLEHLRTNGVSQQAFTFGKPFDAPTS